MDKQQKANTAIRLDPAMKIRLNTALAAKGTTLQAVVAAYLDRWLQWAKEGGPEPGIVAPAPKPEPLPSVQVLRASRALLTVLQNYVKVLELSLNRSQFSDIHTSTGDEVLDLDRARVLLAELGALLGGPKDEAGDDEASATFDAARTFADRASAHGRDEEDRGAGTQGARRRPKK